MATISKALYVTGNDAICQGDVFQNVKYNYIETEDDDSVSVIEFEFPYAIIISQACDVIAMDRLFCDQSGKPAKFMPSILMCPIYDKAMAKSGKNIEDVFNALSINMIEESVIQKDDDKVAQRDWHYRFHALSIHIENKAILDKAVLDFKHYFTLPMSYLIRHKADRVCRLDDLFAEQVTLKFSTYLSRVAIP